MECKHQKINCVTRIISTTWEEARACDHGVSCNYKETQVKE